MATKQSSVVINTVLVLRVLEGNCAIESIIVQSTVNQKAHSCTGHSICSS
jgi:hypothetical protein